MSTHQSSSLRRLAVAVALAVLCVAGCADKRPPTAVRAPDAALSAAKLRFRPIIMTSLAFILGCLPLAISTGAGANSRHAIGTGVIGGMLGATLLAPFFIPVFFKLIMGLGAWAKRLTGGHDNDDGGTPA